MIGATGLALGSTIRHCDPGRMARAPKDYGDPPTEPNGSLLFKAKDLVEPGRISAVRHTACDRRRRRLRALIGVLREATHTQAEVMCRRCKKWSQWWPGMSRGQRKMRSRPTSDPAEGASPHSIKTACCWPETRKQPASIGVQVASNRIPKYSARARSRLAEIERRRRLKKRDRRRAAVIPPLSSIFGTRGSLATIVPPSR